MERIVWSLGGLAPTWVLLFVAVVQHVEVSAYLWASAAMFANVVGYIEGRVKEWIS